MNVSQQKVSQKKETIKMFEMVSILNGFNLEAVTLICYLTDGDNMFWKFELLSSNRLDVGASQKFWRHFLFCLAHPLLM